MKKKLSALLLAGAILFTLSACNGVTPGTSHSQTGDLSPQGEQILEADVVIIGAGGAGMTAGITAARAGRDKKVVILEKTDRVGGNTIRSAGGMSAAKTVYQDDNGWLETASLENTLASAQGDPQLADLARTVRQEYTDWLDDGARDYFDSPSLFALDAMIAGKGENDLSLVTTLAEGSAGAIDWLGGIGASLHGVSAADSSTVRRLHRPVNSKGKIVELGSYLVPLLEQGCIDNGVEILFNAPATQILTENGAVTGVKAQGYTIYAPAVVIATGGFGSDLELVARLRPEWKSFATISAPCATGDGLQMAQAIGAATVDLERIQVCPTVEKTSSALISEGLLEKGGILVNAEGLRFCNETEGRDAVSGAELEQPGGYSYLILDHWMEEAYNVIDGYIEKGYALQGDTYAQLARAMGVPEEAFSETMEQWNASTAAGRDTLFGRTSFSVPLVSPPYYAIRVFPAIYQTTGGLKIDSQARVIGTDDTPIPGLYAAGEVTGGVHGALCPEGNAATDFVVFGRIAGEEAIEYLKNG